MKQNITIVTRTKIANPNYSEDVARVSEANKTPYPTPKEIDYVKRTSILINGEPVVISKLSSYITEQFEVE